MSLSPSFWRKKWSALVYFSKDTSAFGAGLIFTPLPYEAEVLGQISKKISRLELSRKRKQMEGTVFFLYSGTKFNFLETPLINPYLLPHTPQIKPVYVFSAFLILEDTISVLSSSCNV